MQEVNYKITIENSTGQGNRTPVSTQTQPEGTQSAQPVSQPQATAQKDKGVVTAGIVAVQHITPYVNQIVNFGVSQIGADTGAVELQQRTQVVTSAVSAGTSIALGAVVGGVPGALVSMAFTALQSAISYIQQTQAIQTQRRIENDNIALRKSRLGQTVNRSRGGNVV